MIVANEFARPIRLDTLGDAARTVTIEAEPDERAALAKRFGLVAIDALAATAAVRRAGETVFAEGRLSASVSQSCVVTADPLPATIDELFTLRFEPQTAAAPDADEVELAEPDLDVIAYSGGAIDLGEAVAETLALALDPFPRAPDADTRLREAGVKAEGEEEVGPFAALKGLKDTLGGGA